MPHDLPYYIKDIDNRISHPTGFSMWNGWGSVAHHSGPMFQYILQKAASRPEKTLVVSSCSDDMFPIPDKIIEYAKHHNAVVIAPILCSFGPIKPRECLYIPACDEYFLNSIYDIFAPHRVLWEQKINAAVWRGGLSGETMRIDTVKACMNMPNTDVKLIDRWARPEYNPEKTPEYFAEQIDAYGQCKYKAIFWIDGNCITSNLLWIFGSGSVPIIVNESNFWCKNKLIPWVHFVPVKSDMSDIEQNIRWIFEHDDEARKIAENALEFCRTVLSPEGQRAYLDEAIERHIQENQKPAPKQTPTVMKLFPLLTFGGHGPDRYVRKRGFLLLDAFQKFYESSEKNETNIHLKIILKIVKELINISDFPDVRTTVLEALDLFMKEFPNIKLHYDISIEDK